MKYFGFKKYFYFLIFAFSLFAQAEASRLGDILSKILETKATENNISSEKRYCKGRELKENEECEKPIFNKPAEPKDAKTNSQTSFPFAALGGLDFGSLFSSFGGGKNFGKGENATQPPEPTPTTTFVPAPTPTPAPTTVPTPTPDTSKPTQPGDKTADSPKPEPTNPKEIPLTTAALSPLPKPTLPKDTKTDENRIFFVKCDKSIQTTVGGNLLSGKILEKGVAGERSEIIEKKANAFSSQNFPGKCFLSSQLYYLAMQTFDGKKYGLIFEKKDAINLGGAKVGQCAIIQNNVVVKLNEITGHYRTNCARDSIPFIGNTYAPALNDLKKAFNGDIYLLVNNKKVEFR